MIFDDLKFRGLVAIPPLKFAFCQLDIVSFWRLNWAIMRPSESTEACFGLKFSSDLRISAILDWISFAENPTAAGCFYSSRRLLRRVNCFGSLRLSPAHTMVGCGVESFALRIGVGCPDSMITEEFLSALTFSGSNWTLERPECFWFFSSS